MADLYPQTFFTYFDLINKDNQTINILVTYYAFTSLSTVGFGDFHPRSDIERVFCALMLLNGVAIFSYIMGNFIAILNQFNAYNKDHDEAAKLSQFFGTLKQFNENKELPIKLKNEIEIHLYYRWKKDRNVAFQGDEA